MQRWLAIVAAVLAVAPWVGVAALFTLGGWSAVWFLVVPAPVLAGFGVVGGFATVRGPSDSGPAGLAIQAGSAYLTLYLGVAVVIWLR